MSPPLARAGAELGRGEETCNEEQSISSTGVCCRRRRCCYCRPSDGHPGLSADPYIFLFFILFFIYQFNERRLYAYTPATACRDCTKVCIYAYVWVFSSPHSVVALKKLRSGGDVARQPLAERVARFLRRGRAGVPFVSSENLAIRLLIAGQGVTERSSSSASWHAGDMASGCPCHDTVYMLPHMGRRALKGWPIRCSDLGPHSKRSTFKWLAHALVMSVFSKWLSNHPTLCY